MLAQRGQLIDPTARGYGGGGALLGILELELGSQPLALSPIPKLFDYLTTF